MPAFIRRIIPFLLFFVSVVSAYGQLPSCPSNMVYYIGNGQIYNYDPTQPLSSTNPSLNSITPPLAADALAVNYNLNALSPSPTFYTVGTIGSTGTYFYYNGTSWVNTWNTAGAVNIGGGGGYVYGLDVTGTTGHVWKYDGSANATQIVSIPGFVGPYDVVGNCGGDFYLLNTNNQNLKEYNQTGTLINTWTISGTYGSGGTGLGMIGNDIYYAVDSAFYHGVISGSNINFSFVGIFSVVCLDFGTCPVGVAGYVEANTDTAFYCAGGTAVSLYASGNGPFTWSVLNGPAIISGSGDTISVIASSTSKIVLKTSVSTVCADPDTVSFIVNTTPSLSLGSNSPVCSGAALNLTASSAPSSIYHWSGPNGFSSNSQNTSRTNIGLADSGYYYVTDTFYACVSTDSAFVSVKASPAIPVATNNSPFCAGDTLKLAVTDATVGVTYSWAGPGAFVSNLQYNDILNAQSANAGTYGVSATLNGCSESASTFVTIEPLLGTPLVNINVSPSDSICVGQNITLSATASIGTGFTYQWKRNGINIPGATIAVFTTASVNNGDVFKCLVKSNAPCQYIDSGVSNSITMHVVSLSPPSVTLSHYPLNYAQGDTVTFTGHVPQGSQGLSYSWTRNGIIIPGVTTSVLTTSNVNEGDTICLIVHSSIPCTFPDSVKICSGLSTGIFNLQSADKHVNIYPNPARSVLHIDAEIKVNVSISAIDGKILLMKDNAGTIDISSIANAVYIVRVYDENGVLLKTEKLVRVP